MAEFISKLQYKTCEKGEYFDEKARNQNQTIELINNFPWQREQYADLGPTGPSITILDEKGNYLKLSIYYGGKFTLYYLDRDNNYYKLGNINMEKSLGFVRGFFSGSLPLADFEKQAWNWNVRRHFTTNLFEYTVTFWGFLALMTFWILYFILFFPILVLGVIKGAWNPLLLFSLIISLALGWPIVYASWIYRRKKNQQLIISRGRDEFWFGERGNLKKYDKNEIAEIKNFVDKSSRSPNQFEIIEVIFKNGDSINFSNMLIGYSDLLSKFSDKWKFKRTTVGQNLFKILGKLKQN